MGEKNWEKKRREKQHKKKKKEYNSSDILCETTANMNVKWKLKRRSRSGSGGNINRPAPRWWKKWVYIYNIYMHEYEWENDRNGRAHTRFSTDRWISIGGRWYCGRLAVSRLQCVSVRCTALTLHAHNHPISVWPRHTNTSTAIAYTLTSRAHPETN